MAFMMTCASYYKCRIIRKARAMTLIVSTMLLFSACGSGPPPRLYLLERPPVPADASDSIAQSTINALGISEVKVPGYASDTRIANLKSNGVVVQIDDERWAEEPEDAITRLFAEQLRRRTGSSVLIEPWPRDYDPEARVEVTVEKLVREPDGGANLSGRIYLISGDGRRLLKALAFNTRASGSSLDATEFFRAVAVIVDELARLSIEALQALEAQS